MNSWHRWGRIGAGALGALLIGWLAVAFGVWLTIVVVDYLAPPAFLFPPMEFVLGFGVPWLVALPVIGFAMGLVCALFWQKVASVEQQKHWAIGLLIVFFFPVAILGLAAMCVLSIEFPLMLFALRQGLDSRPRWPHFFGLSNDYERNQNSKSEPPRLG